MTLNLATVEACYIQTFAHAVAFLIGLVDVTAGEYVHLGAYVWTLIAVVLIVAVVGRWIFRGVRWLVQKVCGYRIRIVVERT